MLSGPLSQVAGPVEIDYPTTNTLMSQPAPTNNPVTEYITLAFDGVFVITPEEYEELVRIVSINKELGALTIADTVIAGLLRGSEYRYRDIRPLKDPS
jgi:hypothetical protein